MTQLTYRGTRYYKEDQAEADRLDWNNRHRPQLFLRYRTLRYRPYRDWWSSSFIILILQLFIKHKPSYL